MTADTRRKPSPSFPWGSLFKVALALILIGAVVSKTSFQEVASLQGTLSWPWLITSFALFFLLTVTKGVQYWSLLGDKSPFRQILKIIIIQNALTNLVASTAGTASFLTMFRLEQNVKLRQSGLAFVLTKVSDLLFMSFFLTLSTCQVWMDMGALRRLSLVLVAVSLSGIAVFWFVLYFRRVLAARLECVAARLSLARLGLVRRVIEMLRNVAEHEDAIISHALLRGTLFSFLYMTLTMLFAYARVQTFGIPIGFWETIFVASMMQFVSILPLQILGGLGVTEVSLIYLYSVFGIVENIPAILLALRALFYLFHLAVLGYIPLDAFLAGQAAKPPGK